MEDKGKQRKIQISRFSPPKHVVDTTNTIPLAEKFEIIGVFYAIRRRKAFHIGQNGGEFRNLIEFLRRRPAPAHPETLVHEREI